MWAQSAPDCSTITYSDGDGNGKLDVGTLAQLQCLKNEGLGKDFEMTGDIDASTTSSWNGSKGFDPIGASGSAFTGTFDGNGHVITGLYIDRSNKTGLFESVGSGAKIKNVGLEDVDVSGTDAVGGLVGVLNGMVTQSYATGSVSGENAVGGLVGLLDGTVKKSYVAASVVASDDNVGGLVGECTGTVRQSYATGSVSGRNRIGGLIGLVDWGAGQIAISYATASVSSNISNGLTGGLVGDNVGVSVVDSYWNTETSGQSSSDGGMPLTTTEMKGDAAKSKMGGFDFSSTWAVVDEGNNSGDAVSYPYLVSNRQTPNPAARRFRLTIRQSSPLVRRAGRLTKKTARRMC